MARKSTPERDALIAEVIEQMRRELNEQLPEQPGTLELGGSAVNNLSTSWSFSPGEGVIDQSGAFTGYTSGEYIVTASQGDDR